MTENLILVDENDNEIGIMEKMEAHEKGLLHRAFSVFIFRKNESTDKIEVLLQQRQKDKYHSPLLWTNTCCSHPRPGESASKAAIRRLKEEMNFETKLYPQGTFIYKAEFDNNLIEHELDHLFIGIYDSNNIKPNPIEVESYKWISFENLNKDLEKNPKDYTAWFPIAYNFLKESDLLKELDLLFMHA